PVRLVGPPLRESGGGPRARRGMWSGAKDVLRRRGTIEAAVVPAGPRAPAGGPWDQMLKPLVTGGRIARDLPPPRTIREFVLDQLSRVPLDTIRRPGLRRDF